ncbi:MAG: tetratricopeptide repeat protein, partial [Spirochaetales bacterium]|nr:tetratricopeptide repeat protein [Spirochaetales bacterium]
MNRLFWAISLFLVLVSLSCRTSGASQELARDYYNIGNAYSDLDNHEKAASYYKRALDLDPEINQAAYNLARSSLEIEDYDLAIRLLTDLQEKDEANLMVLEMLGYTWYQKGDAARAAEYYRKSLEVDPAHLRSLYNLSILEKENERWGMAGQYLERLLELEEKKEYRILLAELAVDMGELDKAILYYEDLIVEYEGDSGIYLSMKDLYMETERYYKALDMLELLTASGSDAELVPGYFFEKATLEIDILDDPVNGRKSLKSALEKGYSDRESL